MPAARVQGDSRIGGAFIEPFAFDPSQLFINNIQGAWYDPSDVNTTWRRNLLTYTEQFNNAPWVALNASISANATTAPDGTTTADAIIENALSGLHLAYYVGAPLSVGANCASVYVKAAGRNFAILRITNPAVSISVNLTTLVAVAAEGTPVGTTVTDVGNGWRRISFSATQVGSGQVQVWASIDGSINPYTGDGASGIYVWGAQLEVGSSATAYQQIVTPEITYASTQLTNLFQDAAGLTPVWAVEQPVGLVFDKRLGPTARRNLLTYTEQFETGWSYASVTISANATTAPDGSTTADKIVEDTAVGAGRAVYQQINVGTATWSVYVKSAGNSRWLRLQTGASNNSWFNPDTGLWGTVDSGVSASVVALPNGWYRVSLTGTASAPTYMALGLATGNGNQTYNGDGTSGIFVWGAQLEVASTASTYQKITSGVGGEWTPGNHAYQSTAASRPVLRARYNLLTYSEQFSNAVWPKVNVTVVASAGVAPDGTNTASLVYPSSSGTIRTIYEAGPGTTAASTTSFYVKASGKSWVWVVGTIGSSSTGAYFNVSTGTKGLEFPGYTGNISSVGNGWYRVSVSGPSEAMSYVQLIITDADASTAVTANGTDGVLLWGAQLLTAADATATGNAYQRVGASTDYATGGVFRPYLAFDGVDDRLQTASVNIASNAVSLFAGHSIQTAGGWGTLVASGAAGGGGIFLMISDTTGAAAFQNFRSEGTLASQINSSTFAYPYLDVWTMQANISTDTLIARRDGAQTATSSSDQGTGTYASNAMYVGSYNGANWHYPGRIYGLIVRGAASSAVEVAQTESWLNAKTGAY